MLGLLESRGVGVSCLVSGPLGGQAGEWKSEEL